jgi:virulence factor Mce-like protein
MNNRPRNQRFQTFAASPVMVGALTVLIALVALYLAYNANHGLPFVPTYDVTAEVPNSEDLFPNNEVRIGGIRVGVIDKVDAVQQDNGGVYAKLHMKLDKGIGPVPVDSTVVVRPRSSLGLKYLQLTPGHSSQTYPSGATMPLTAARPAPVELDDLFNTFDTPTRVGIQGNLQEFGNALAGRGADLNDAIGSLRNFSDSATPVMKNLASMRTNFGGFWRSLELTSAEVAPVGQQQADFFKGLDETFGGFARVAYPYLQDTISKSPPTEDAVSADLPALRPFFGHSANFFHELQPGIHALAVNSTDLAVGISRGVPALAASPKLNAQLAPTAQSLLGFQNAPGVLNGLDLLSSTNNYLDSPLAFITPSQTVCNYLTLLFGNAASIGSNGDGIGTWTRALAFTPPTGKNNEGSPAGAPANGPSDASDIFPGRQGANHLHYNPYPNTAAPGQTRECEAGNEAYVKGQTVIGNSPGNQGTSTFGQPTGKKPKKKKKKGGGGK